VTKACSQKVTAEFPELSTLNKSPVVGVKPLLTPTTCYYLRREISLAVLNAEHSAHRGLLLPQRIAPLSFRSQ
jgi:hypothetical protein